MGGRGKSPLVAYLARLLLDAGERPAILSRGYKRRVPLDGVTVVSDGATILADLDHSGDEPLMLARAVPRAIVLVCEQRATAAALATTALGATINLLDDGFQHRAMRRDLDLVVIAPQDLTDRRVPFGRLREAASALARADAVIVDQDDTTNETEAGSLNVPRPVPVFQLRRAHGRPVPLENGAPWPASVNSVVAVAGIARPDRFSASLTRAGWNVARMLPFGDHHRYRARDLEMIRAAVQATHADVVVTTAKDAVRLERLGPLGVPVGAVPLDVTVEPADKFRAWLFDRIRAAGAPKPFGGGGRR
jgi:tetraacyldisaccharide 4'-kinase